MSKTICATAFIMLLALTACAKGNEQIAHEEVIGQQEYAGENTEEDEDSAQDKDNEEADEFMKFWEERFTSCNWKVADSTETIWTGVLAGGPCDFRESYPEVIQVLYIESLGVGEYELTAADKANGFVYHIDIGPLDPAYRIGMVTSVKDQDISDVEWGEWQSDPYDPARGYGHDLRIDLYLTHDGEWVVDLPLDFGYGWGYCSIPPEEVWPEFTCDDIKQ